jgi:hypothetical protein
MAAQGTRGAPRATSVLPVEFTAQVVGDGWTAGIQLDGDGQEPVVPEELVGAFNVHLQRTACDQIACQRPVAHVPRAAAHQR